MEGGGKTRAEKRGEMGRDPLNDSSGKGGEGRGNSERRGGVGGCRVWERGKNRETVMILEYKTFRLITRGLYGRGRW